MSPIQEPKIFQDILLSQHEWMTTHDYQHLLGIISDYPVFLYPVLLMSMYLYGHHTNNKQHKHNALYIFMSAVWIFIANYIIKTPLQRDRPYEVLNLDIPLEELAMDKIPTDSFPSDHAAMAATIATALCIIGYKQNNTTYKILWCIARWLALIMWIGRITIAIHRPTDIIAGTLVWITIAIIMRIIYKSSWGEKFLQLIQKIDNLTLSKVWKR